MALLTLIAACSGTAATPLPTLPPTAVPTPMPSLSPTATPEPVYTITGSLSLTAISGWTFATGGCISKGSYDDIRTGTDVTVKDQTGTIIAAGRLEPGDVDVDPLSCKFPFTIADVSTATFYAIEVGHRGALTYSFNELRGRGWRVDFTLGD